MWDHLIQDFDPTKDNYGDVAAHPERVDLNYALPELSRTDKQPDRRDWLHGNALSRSAACPEHGCAVGHDSACCGLV